MASEAFDLGKAMVRAREILASLEPPCPDWGKPWVPPVLRVAEVDDVDGVSLHRIGLGSDDARYIVLTVGTFRSTWGRDGALAWVLAHELYHAEDRHNPHEDDEAETSEAYRRRELDADEDAILKVLERGYDARDAIEWFREQYGSDPAGYKHPSGAERLEAMVRALAEFEEAYGPH